MLQAAIAGGVAMALLRRAPSGKYYDPADEAVGDGYGPGGQALEAPTVGRDARGAFVRFTTPTIWRNASVRASHVALYRRADGLLLRVDVLPADARESRYGNFIVVLPENALRLRAD
jgi:hypothetical protein